KAPGQEREGPVRLDRQGEIKGRAGSERHRDPQRPALVLGGDDAAKLEAQKAGRAGGASLAAGPCRRPPFPGPFEIHPPSSSTWPALGGGGRPVLDPPAHVVASIIAETGPNVTARRHPICPLPDRLPPYWRGAHRVVQLGLCPAPWRPHAAAHRGYRP